MGGSPIASSDWHGGSLVLASGSPRRLALLRQIGIEPDLTEVPDIDETPRPRELPHLYVRRMAETKAAVVGARHDGAFVLAADTVVACGRRILPKATVEAEAMACLDLLSGRRHRVLGGICVLAPDRRRSLRLVTTSVSFRRIDVAERGRYIASGEWLGKAGGYAIQGRAAAFVPAINGSYANIVGLAVVEALAMLKGLGWRRPA